MTDDDRPELLYVSPEERAAGLGHQRSGIRRRASLSPLIFLIGTALVVAGLSLFQAFRSEDELESTVSYELTNIEGRTEVSSVITITNFDDDAAIVLSVRVNASGPIVSQSSTLSIVGSPDEPVDTITEPAIPGGGTAVISFDFAFECVDGDEFVLDPVVRLQLHQKGLVRVLSEPNGNRNGQGYVCLDGATVAR